jgi:hypothetical protein
MVEMPQQRDERAVHDASMSELVQRASQQTSELVRQEIRLAEAELKDKSRKLGRGAGLLGAGGLMAVYGGATLIAAAALGLATAIAPWLAALIVGLVILAISAGLALVGKNEASQALPPRPEQAATSVQDDLQHIKERAAR